ncbi:thioesterase family protein [Taklimakanibacter lacteus]|uniref:thioesterase family protein n=1 Tax=Taklimakanibacter lacteus TaxID=2268456 RepID=UPI000E667C14
MKDSLKPGVTHRFVYRVPREKTVPFLYPEAPSFQAMPEVFATGYMVGLMEWASIELLKPHLDEGEGSLGTHIDVSHLAATPPGFEVTVDTEVTKVDGRRVWFKISASDGIDKIGEGSHERAVVVWQKFKARVAEKAVRQ